MYILSCHCKSHIQIPYNCCYWLISVSNLKLLMMACLTLLLITTILTVASEATPLYCSDVQSPAASGSHNTADLSKIQYCIINNTSSISTNFM